MITNIFQCQNEKLNFDVLNVKPNVISLHFSSADSKMIVDVFVTDEQLVAIRDQINAYFEGRFE